MKRSLTLIALLGLGLSLSAPVFADHRHESRVDGRQDRQWDRIERGHDTGDLTRREFRRLKKEQRQIARLERVFLKDGRLNRRERGILEARQDEASQNIRRLIRNDREVSYRHRDNREVSYRDRDNRHQRRHW